MRFPGNWRIAALPGSPREMWRWGGKFPRWRLLRKREIPCDIAGHFPGKASSRRRLAGEIPGKLATIRLPGKLPEKCGASGNALSEIGTFLGRMPVAPLRSSPVNFGKLPGKLVARTSKITGFGISLFRKLAGYPQNNWVISKLGG